MTAGATRSLILVRTTYWLGALFDALAGLRMLRADSVLPENLVAGPGFKYAMWTGAALMLSWSCLLLWADRDPLERRGVLFLTACPALLGLAVAQCAAVQTGIRTATQAVPFWALEGILATIFMVSYFVAGGLATEAPK